MRKDGLHAINNRRFDGKKRGVCEMPKPFPSIGKRNGTINRLTIISSKIKKKELDLVINIHDSLHRFAIVCHESFRAS